MFKCISRQVSLDEISHSHADRSTKGGKFESAVKSAASGKCDLHPTQSAITALNDAAVRPLPFDVLAYIGPLGPQINAQLRAGEPDVESRLFLAAFKKLPSFDGIAHRVAMLTPDVRETLLKTGVKVMDEGIQSASLSATNARDRQSMHMQGQPARPGGDLLKAMLVFDKDIPKKNLSSERSRDHVAVPAGTVLQVVSVTYKGAMPVIGLALAGEQALTHDVYSMSDGAPAWRAPPPPPQHVRAAPPLADRAPPLPPRRAADFPPPLPPRTGR